MENKTNLYGWVFLLLVYCVSYLYIGVYTHNWMYIGQDGTYNLWLTKAYINWAHPLDISAFNPLQGMTSTLMPVNGYLNPSSWILASHGFLNGESQVLSFVTYFSEVAISTFILSIFLGFSRGISFLCAILITLFLFPPTNFSFGIPGYITSSGFYAHTMALCNLFVALIASIPPFDHNNPLKQWGMRIWLPRALAMSIIVLLIMISAPFYNPPLLIGYFIVAATVILASTHLSQFYARSAAVAIVGLTLISLGFIQFLFTSSAILYRPGAETVGSILYNMCEGGFGCLKFKWAEAAGLPVPAVSGSFWITIVSFLGAVTAIFSPSKAISRLAIAFSVILSMFTLWFFLQIFNMFSPTLIKPFHVGLALYPLRTIFLAYFIIFSMKSCISLITPYYISSTHFKALFLAFILTISWICIEYYVSLYTEQASITLQLGITPETSYSTPFMNILKSEIALKPGTTFRGLVATILGSTGGSIRKPLGLTPQEPLPPFTYMKFNELISESGGQHDSLYFWWKNIPTLSEYGQGISKPLAIYMNDFLGDGENYVVRNVAIPKKINLPILRALGVRYIIVDRNVQDNYAILKQKMDLSNGVQLYMYELKEPNLATFSPQTIVPIKSAKSFIELLSTQPNALERVAFVYNKNETDLLPIQKSKMIFKRNSIRIIGKSEGHSAILLPLQFSNCYQIKNHNHNHVEIMRANLIHTLLAFDKNLDVTLKWTFKPWQNTNCRKLDAADFKVLGI